MASDDTIPMQSLQEAILYFADADRAHAFLVEMRWPGGEVRCPTCKSPVVRYVSTRKVWKCGNDHKRAQFSVKIGTIFEDSPLPLTKWLPAVWMIVNCKNGISSYELHRGLGVTQKTAWFMLHRIRLAMQTGTFQKLGGPGKTVEADETWIGGRARSMNAAQRRKTDNPEVSRGPYKYSGKAVVAGLLERGGRVRVKVVPNTRASVMHPLVRANVADGSELHTDQAVIYARLVEGENGADYLHEVVNHAAGEYVRENVHTNGIENFWSLLKRGIKGTYVSVEPFHLFRYLDEQAFRFNERKHPQGDSGRFITALRQIVGKRLTYKRLIGDETAMVAAG